MVAEAEQVELQALTLHHALARHVADVDSSEIGLACNGTQAGELRAVELHEVVVVRVLVNERLQHAGVVIAWILRMLIAQKGNALFRFTRHR